MSYRVLSADDIKSFPLPTWLVHRIIPDNSLAVLYGAWGIGKSFIALDLAHSVAAGIRWLGQRTRQGPVVYVAAGEGVRGLRPRIEAWEQDRRRLITDVSYIPEAVLLHQSTSVHSFLRVVKPLEPSLVVFDTLARCFTGGNENTVEDMGKVIGAADEIRAQTDAAVLLLHHTGRPDDEGNAHERGSSALPAAADMMAELAAGDTPDTRTLCCRKMKDAGAFYPVKIRLKKIRKRGMSDSLVPVHDP